MIYIYIEQEKRRKMVYELLELLKSYKLNYFERKQVYELVVNLEGRTEKQKEKFLRFYNLLEDEKKNYRYCDMARYYGCTSSNIRFSINRIRCSLVNDIRVDMMIIKSILDDYHRRS